MDPPLGRRLYLGQRAVADVLDARLHEHGASLWNWVLLKEAASAGEVSQRELAQRMRIEPPTLVRHLDKLEGDGLVERRPDLSDRRVVRIKVTRAGRARLAKLHDVVHEVDTELRGILSAREVDVLGRALVRIHDHFSANAKEPVHGRS